MEKEPFLVRVLRIRDSEHGGARGIVPIDTAKKLVSRRFLPGFAEMAHEENTGERLPGRFTEGVESRADRLHFIHFSFWREKALERVENNQARFVVFDAAGNNVLVVEHHPVEVPFPVLLAIDEVHLTAISAEVDESRDIGVF